MSQNSDDTARAGRLRKGLGLAGTMLVISSIVPVLAVTCEQHAAGLAIEEVGSAVTPRGGGQTFGGQQNPFEEKERQGGGGGGGGGGAH